MKKFSSETQKRGKLGEDIAVRYLAVHGFFIIDRNFTRKWGEIDIIALKSGIVHFIEVKSVSRENDAFRPEDQVHYSKQRKLARIIQTYLIGRDTVCWQFDVMCVYLNETTRKARIKVLDNIILA